MTDLPAGFVKLDGVAVHVAQLRQHTTDVRRFLHCYPICRALEQHEPGTPAWHDIVRGLTAEQRKGVALTLTESATLFHALAEKLEGSSAVIPSPPYCDKCATNRATARIEAPAFIDGYLDLCAECASMFRADDDPRPAA